MKHFIRTLIAFSLFVLSFALCAFQTFWWNQSHQQLERVLKTYTLQSDRLSEEADLEVLKIQKKLSLFSEKQEQLSLEKWTLAFQDFFEGKKVSLWKIEGLEDVSDSSAQILPSSTVLMEGRASLETLIDLFEKIGTYPGLVAYKKVNVKLSGLKTNEKEEALSVSLELKQFFHH